MFLFKQNHFFPLNENYMKPKCKNQMKVEQLGESVCVCVGVWNSLY